jgi:hypothetical protein
MSVTRENAIICIAENENFKPENQENILSMQLIIFKRRLST